jgi:general secretion pathway protein D
LRKGQKFKTVAVAAVSIALICSVLASTPSPANGQQDMRLNYVNADIRDVIQSLATVMGVNLLISEDVPARRVTYTTPAPVPNDQVGAVFEAILESEGLVLVRRGPVAEVMPAERAPATSEIHFGKELPSPPPLGLITQIVPLQHIRAEEGMAVLEQLVSPTARLEIVPRSNSLLITDRGTSVARYLDLISQLDVRADGEGGLRTYVYRLKHANGVDLAMTLGQLFGATVAPVQSPGRFQSLQDRSLSSSLSAFRDREYQQLEQRRQMEIPLQLQSGPDTMAGPGDAGALLGETVIVPDLATNSLVIRTAPPNYPVLEETIDALDLRPAQVLLEVLVAEVRLDEQTQYGINWAILGEEAEEGSDISAAAKLGPQGFTDSEFSAGQDLAVRVVKLGSQDYFAILRALASEDDVRVLSTPHVLALNNEEARVFVGAEVPFNQSTRTGLDVVIDQTIQYQNVGTQLTMIPTINDDGYVTFRILQEVSNLTGSTVAAAQNAPVITTREAETSALVGDGQTIVIGGLIDEGSEQLETGVPILRSIPGLGRLFKSVSNRRFRTELAIFVTPYIVYTDEDAAALLEREQNRLRTGQDLEDVLNRKPDTTRIRN